MDKPSLQLIHGTARPAREHGLQRLFATLKAPDATIAEANLRMRAWLAASLRPTLRLAHAETLSAGEELAPSDAEMESLLELEDALLGNQVPMEPPARPLTR